MIKHQQAKVLLQSIQAQLKQLSLWQSEYPSAQALSSLQPFCCDTLRFEQWLQFILIPRMTTLIDGNLPLPDKIAIAPMAEQSFRALGLKADVLIAYLNDFDQLLSQ